MMTKRYQITHGDLKCFTNLFECNVTTENPQSAYLVLRSKVEVGSSRI